MEIFRVHDSVTTPTESSLSRLQNGVRISISVCDTGRGMPRISRVMRMGQSYFCDICNLSLNSEMAYNDHVNGMKHLKKARNIERAQVLREAGLDTDLPAKRKATAQPPCVSFHDLVKSSGDPVVGELLITGQMPIIGLYK